MIGSDDGMVVSLLNQAGEIVEHSKEVNHMSRLRAVEDSHKQNEYCWLHTLIDFVYKWIGCNNFIKMKNEVQFVEVEQELQQQSKSNEHIGEGKNNSKYKQKLANDDSDQDERTRIAINRKIYGNMLVIRSSTPHLSLGPDYCCFLPAFIAFSTASYFLILLVFSIAQSQWFKIVTLIICVGQPLSYLLVALSNPGVITQPLAEGPETKICTKCQICVPRHARHCGSCNLCVQNYDHHCPWVSKCIGGNNLTRFYIFLGMTPIYFIYMTVAFVVCMSANVLNAQKLSKNL